MSRLKEHGIKVTYYDGLEYDGLVKFHQENGAAKLGKYGQLEEVPALLGAILRETKRVNLVEGYGYCVVRFTIDKGVSGCVHSHNHACNSNVLRGELVENNFEINDGKPKWLNAELRKAGNFSSRIPVGGKPLETDINNSDTHAIANFSSGVTILEHLYPVSDGVVRLLNSFIKSVDKGIEKQALYELVAEKEKYGEKATKILQEVLDEHKGAEFSPQDFRTKLVEEILRKDTNKTYFVSQEEWVSKAKAVYVKAEQSGEEPKLCAVVQNVKGKWASNSVVTPDSKWESQIYRSENVKLSTVR